VTGRTGDVLGPVQVLLIGLDEPGSELMLAAELQDLHSQDAVRPLDVLRVRREADGGVRRLDPPAPEGYPGTLVEALLVSDPGGAEEDEGRARGAEVGDGDREGEAVGEGEWFLTDRLPRGAAAAILLLEHRWAIPLREAATGVRAEVFGDAWVHPRDLAAARRVAGRARAS
jgi:hypothetical protein